MLFKSIDNIYKSLQKKTPFVVYRKPNSDVISGLFLNDNELYFTKTFSEEGFVFAPFDSSNEALFFPIEKAYFFEENISYDSDSVDLYTPESSTNEIERNLHIERVSKAIDTIKKGKAKKIVVSRKEEVLLGNLNITSVFKDLLQKYRNAFVYIWYHPKVGLWMGATPETLVQVTKDTFTTMSLAGTKTAKTKKEVKWTSKEYDEQKMVTDFITKNVKDKVYKLKIGNIETVSAGKLYHLKTKISGELKDTHQLKNIIEALHPTPAICGFPRDVSKNFILENENYDREFYTGFLGELNFGENKSSSLYVNLRCMKIKEKKAIIYVGGGITKDSNSIEEWEETVSKAKTMKAVLNK